MANTVNLGVGFYEDQKSLARLETSLRRRLKGIDSKPFTQPLGKITGDLNEFQSALDASAARVLAFGASASVFAVVLKGIKDLVGATVQVEKSLTDINVVFGLTSKNLKQFGRDIFSVAKETSQSFSTVAEAATELARQGLSTEETLLRLKDAMILSRVSGLDATASVEALTAALNGFKSEALDSTKIVDRLTAVDQAFAVSSEDLAQGLARASAVAQGAGIRFNELLAQITAVQQTTARGGAVIGNGLKSIATRIQRSNVREALEGIGVATQEANGDFRNATSILLDYAQVYKTLSDEQQAYTSELLAGVFQINTLKALVNDLSGEYSIYERALEKANSAQGEANIKNQALNKTIAVLGTQTLETLREFGSAFGEILAGPSITNFLKIVKSFFDDFNKLLTSEDSIGKFLQGALKGVASFISGPALAVVANAARKLLVFLARESLKAFQEIQKIGGSLNKAVSSEKELVQVTKKEVEVRQTLQRIQDYNAKLSQQELDTQKQKLAVLEAQAKYGSAKTFSKNPLILSRNKRPLFPKAREVESSGLFGSSGKPSILGTKKTFALQRFLTRELSLGNNPSLSQAKRSIGPNSNNTLISNSQLNQALARLGARVSGNGTLSGTQIVSFNKSVIDSSRSLALLTNSSSRLSKVMGGISKVGQKFAGKGLGAGLLAQFALGGLEGASERGSRTNTLASSAGTGLNAGILAGLVNPYLGIVTGVLTTTFAFFQKKAQNEIDKISLQLEERSSNLEQGKNLSNQLKDLILRRSRALDVGDTESLTALTSQINEVRAALGDVSSSALAAFSTEIANTTKTQESLVKTSRKLDQIFNNLSKEVDLLSFDKAVKELENPTLLSRLTRSVGFGKQFTEKENENLSIITSFAKKTASNSLEDASLDQIFKALDKIGEISSAFGDIETNAEQTQTILKKTARGTKRTKVTQEVFDEFRAKEITTELAAVIQGSVGTLGEQAADQLKKQIESLKSQKNIDPNTIKSKLQEIIEAFLLKASERGGELINKNKVQNAISVSGEFLRATEILRTRTGPDFVSSLNRQRRDSVTASELSAGLIGKQRALLQNRNAAGREVIDSSLNKRNKLLASFFEQAGKGSLTTQNVEQFRVLNEAREAIRQGSFTKSNLDSLKEAFKGNEKLLEPLLEIESESVKTQQELEKIRREAELTRQEIIAHRKQDLENARLDSDDINKKFLKTGKFNTVGEAKIFSEEVDKLFESSFGEAIIGTKQGKAIRKQGNRASTATNIVEILEALGINISSKRQLNSQFFSQAQQFGQSVLNNRNSTQQEQALAKALLEYVDLAINGGVTVKTERVDPRGAEKVTRDRASGADIINNREPPDKSLSDYNPSQDFEETIKGFLNKVTESNKNAEETTNKLNKTISEAFSKISSNITLDGGLNVFIQPSEEIKNVFSEAVQDGIVKNANIILDAVRPEINSQIQKSLREAFEQ